MGGHDAAVGEVSMNVSERFVLRFWNVMKLT